MSAEDTEIVTPENDTTEEVVKTTDESTEETLEPEHTEFEKKQFERAKKAEAENKKLKEQLKAAAPRTEVAKTDSQISSYDTIALIENKVTAKEDIDEVIDYAKLKNISIGEALKSTVVKTILKEKAEQRQTANATSTGGAKRVSSKVSDEALIEASRKGELPESDQDMQRLVEARLNSKRKK